MFDFKVEVLNIRQIERQFSFISRDIPKWISVGLTQTAYQSRKEVVRAMLPALDRPTPWVRNTVWAYPAEKTHNPISAAVGYAHNDAARRATRRREALAGDDAPRSMRMQIYGGGRQLKEHEKTLQRAGISPPGRPFIVPGVGAEKDRFGNVTTGFINKVLYTGAAGGNAGRSGDAVKPLTRGARGKRSRNKVRYFPHPRRNPRGIYRAGRYGTAPLPVFLFVRQPQYSPRFDFYGIANRGASKLVPNVYSALDRGVDRYLRN